MATPVVCKVPFSEPRAIHPRQALGVNLFHFTQTQLLREKLIAKFCFTARRLLKFAELLREETETEELEGEFPDWDFCSVIRKSASETAVCNSTSLFSVGEILSSFTRPRVAPCDFLSCVKKLNEENCEGHTKIDIFNLSLNHLQC